MSSINVCDGCSAMVKGSALGAVQIRTSGNYQESEVVERELCPDCIASVVLLVEGEREPVQRVYKDGWKRDDAASKSVLETLGDTPANQAIANIVTEVMQQMRAIESADKRATVVDSEQS